MMLMGSFRVLLVPQCRLLLWLGANMGFATRTLKLLGVSTRRSWWNTPFFDLLLLKRCLQKSASVLFGSLGPFPMTEFIAVRLKGAEHKDWMAFRHALRRALVSGDLSMPSLVEVVGNIVGVWPLTVSYLKETERKTDVDSLVE